MKGLVSRICNGVRWRVNEIKFVIKLRSRKNIFVFGAPFHSNLGDQAQTFCIKKWIEANYPKHQLYIYDTWELTNDGYYILNRIRKYINKNDMIFLHSGYHTTDLYMLEENMQRKVIELFHDKKIVILPQTIYYENADEMHTSQKIYNSHPNLMLLCRDELSYKTAKDIFKNCKLRLFPDIVTTMIGKFEYNNERNGILLCLRNDKESIIAKDVVEQLQNKLSVIDSVTISDTTIPMKGEEVTKNREEILMSVWKDYSKYRVIITDRYHGTIFSLIANTPVIVLSSSDHKLSSGVKWFPDSFNGYVQYVDQLDYLVDEVKKIYSTDYEYSLPLYFNENYYNKLKGYIEEALS